MPRGPKFDKVVEDFFQLQLLGRARKPEDHAKDFAKARPGSRNSEKNRRKEKTGKAQEERRVAGQAGSPRCNFRAGDASKNRAAPHGAEKVGADAEGQAQEEVTILVSRTHAKFSVLGVASVWYSRVRVWMSLIQPRCDSIKPAPFTKSVKSAAPENSDRRDGALPARINRFAKVSTRDAPSRRSKISRARLE